MAASLPLVIVLLPPMPPLPRLLPSKGLTSQRYLLKWLRKRTWLLRRAYPPERARRHRKTKLKIVSLDKQLTKLENLRPFHYSHQGSLAYVILSWVNWAGCLLMNVYNILDLTELLPICLFLMETLVLFSLLKPAQLTFPPPVCNWRGSDLSLLAQCLS